MKEKKELQLKVTELLFQLHGIIFIFTPKKNDFYLKVYVFIEDADYLISKRIQIMDGHCLAS